jgi:hypothetical protein
MTDVSQINRGPFQGRDFGYNPFAGAAFPPGTPVRQDLLHDDTVFPAQGNTMQSAIVTGIAAGPGIAPVGTTRVRVPCVRTEPLTLTPEQWSVITGDPEGLKRGSFYWVDPKVAGKLTDKQPVPTIDGSFATPVGVAINACTLLPQISVPVGNGTTGVILQ